MKYLSGLIPRYILRTVLPYVMFSWLLLIVILFFQQAGRYSDIFFANNIPVSLVWELIFAIAPNVIAFTCPMAILVGTIIGFSKMQTDNELIALRAAGIANLKIVVPVLAFGFLMTVFAFFINIKAVPLAAGIVRKVALQSALYKFESPIEPGVVNTEINGYTIYVKDGDVENGVWKNIFIYSEDAAHDQVRLITSASGRIDIQDDNSELVLENSLVSTFPKTSNFLDVPEHGKYISENIGEVRLPIKTKRNELAAKLNQTEKLPDELGLFELAKYARQLTGKEQIESLILLDRKIILSLTPLLFALLGAALILRFNRSGRGFGISLGLLSLIVYYLTVLLFEQIARSGRLNPAAAGLMPLLGGLLVGIYLIYSRQNSSNARFKLPEFFTIFKSKISRNFNIFTKFVHYRFLDSDIVINFVKNFLLTFGFLCSIFLIFTAFELWKFAGTIDHGAIILLRYLIYLLPYVYLQLAPSSLMIAVLATYIIKSRQNEIVSWTAAGQSIYRLLLPCFVLALVIGFVNWEIQEKVLPRSNKIQDALRTQLRNQGSIGNKSGKIWTTDNYRIYSLDSYDLEQERPEVLKNLTVYEFSPENSRLKTIYQADEAHWQNGKIRLGDDAEKYNFDNGRVDSEPIGGFSSELWNPFAIRGGNPSHLDTVTIKTEIAQMEDGREKRSFETALQKRYTVLLLPLIIVMFTAPFALSLSRKGKVLTVGLAVGIWLLFVGLTSLFEQFGSSGAMPATAAVWLLPGLFGVFGLYLIFRSKT